MQIFRWGWTLLLALGLLSLLCIGFVGLLGAVWPDLDVINHFRPWWALAGGLALVALPLAQRGWRPALGIVTGFALLLQLPFLVPTWLAGWGAPASALAEEREADLTLVTLNLHYGTRHRQEVIAYLRETEPDLVFLQELPLESLVEFHERLSDLYPHAAHCVDRRFCNLAILSRFPLQNTAASYLGWRRFAEIPPQLPGWPLAESELPDRRKAAAGLTAAIDLGGAEPIQLMNVHLTWPIPAEIQRRQFRWIVERLAALPPGPRLLAGDFNSTPWSFGLSGFEAALPLARVSQGIMSWPTSLRRIPFPIVAIDQIYVSDAFTVEAVSAGPDVGSDHLPIEARLRFVE
ncbi:MAG: endonuclease/exonuclease/phosphatase family protein [Pseudomonadota bacterium]